MDANARTGTRDQGGGGECSKVLGPFGRNALNVNGKRLLRLAEEEELSLVNTFF